jgi:effector-binding domain-containing protein
MTVDQIPIGRFSLITHLTQKALRLYDKKGLLVLGAKDRITGYRYYTIAQIERAVRIRRLSTLGFSLDEIGRILDADGATAAAMMQGRLAAVRQEMGRLREIEEALRRWASPEEVYAMSLSEPVIKEIPEIRVIARREKGTYEDVCSRVIEELMAAIHTPENRRNGMRITGPVMMLCHDEEYREKDADIEIAVPVAGRIAVAEGIEVKTLPAVTAISILHTGPYENLAAAYGAIAAYAAEHGLVLAGPDRELYYNSPGEVGDAELRTEVQYPVSPAE